MSFNPFKIIFQMGFIGSYALMSTSIIIGDTVLFLSTVLAASLMIYCEFCFNDKFKQE